MGTRFLAVSTKEVIVRSQGRPTSACLRRHSLAGELSRTRTSRRRAVYIVFLGAHNERFASAGFLSRCLRAVTSENRLHVEAAREITEDKAGAGCSSETSRTKSV